MLYFLFFFYYFGLIPPRVSENGRTDLAYTLLLQEQFPSWLYTVNLGATTMWEHYDGITLDWRYINARSEEAAMRIIEGTARSMGIEVVDA